MPVFTKYAHGQFSWVDYSAHDGAAAATFYGEVFGWKAEKQDTEGGPPYWIFKKGDHTVAGLGEMNAEMKAGGVPPMWNNYINVTDCAATEKLCVEHGATVVVPTMKVMDAGSLAFVSDPTGAMFALWQADKHIGASLANEPGTFSWNEIATRDVQKAMKFYANVFGWTYDQNDDSPGEYYLAHNDGKMAAGFMQMTDDWPAEVPPYWSVYFSVENADEAAARVKAQGGSARVEPFDIPIGRIAVMCDAQGGGFCLFQSKMG